MIYIIFYSPKNDNISYHELTVKREVTEYKLSKKIIDHEIIECILNKNGIVEKQNSACYSKCGNMTGQKCDKGCQLHIRNTKLKENELNLLRSRKIHNQYFDITHYETENFVFINLYPTLNLNFDFTDFDLTVRELEIAKLMFEGYKNSEIIKILNISKSTLKTHINHIYQKIGDEFKDLRP